MEKSILSNKISLGQVRLLGFLIVFAFFCSLASLVLQNTNLVSDWEDRFQSRYYLLKSYFTQPEAVDLPMILVLIDDHSLPYGTPRSPIDRTWLAGLVDEISSRKPALIGMNILLDRTGEPESDTLLANSLSSAGNVILRDDPFYPVYPLFSKAALDLGTIKFKLDSSDTVQSVCANELSCQSKNLFHQKILDYFNFTNGQKSELNIPHSNWLKINFSVTRQISDSNNLLSFPVIRAHEIKQMPPEAFKEKIVLLGTGFPDLYPLFKVPLSEPQLMIQETELVAQVLSMISGDRYLRSLSSILMAILLLALLSIIAAVVFYKGTVLGLVTAIILTLALFAISGWSFAFYDLEMAFVLPSNIIAFFTLVSMLANSIQDRFTRMETEIQLKQAKIDFLTNELHSHHLFNEFSRLSVMIRQDPAAAREYLVEFAEMLRSSLKYGDQKMVEVESQIDYLNSYLNQQKLIFKGAISFDFEAKGDYTSVKAPWHAFFPILENAVKYTDGYLKKTDVESAEITIRLHVADDKIFLNVLNPYIEGTTVASSKRGIKNLKERLAWAYPKGGYRLEFKPDGSIWSTELELPIS